MYCSSTSDQDTYLDGDQLIVVCKVLSYTVHLFMHLYACMTSHYIFTHEKEMWCVFRSKYGKRVRACGWSRPGGHAKLTISSCPLVTSYHANKLAAISICMYVCVFDTAVTSCYMQLHLIAACHTLHYIVFHGCLLVI